MTVSTIITDELAGHPPAPEALPAPTSPDGQLYPYSPEQAVRWIPFSVRVLRERCYKRLLPHSTNGGRIFFTGRQIEQIVTGLAVEPPKRRGRPAARRG